MRNKIPNNRPYSVGGDPNNCARDCNDKCLYPTRKSIVTATKRSSLMLSDSAPQKTERLLDHFVYVPINTHIVRTMRGSFQLSHRWPLRHAEINAPLPASVNMRREELLASSTMLSSSCDVDAASFGRAINLDDGLLQNQVAIRVYFPLCAGGKIRRDGGNPVITMAMSTRRCCPRTRAFRMARSISSNSPKERQCCGRRYGLMYVRGYEGHACGQSGRSGPDYRSRRRCSERASRRMGYPA